MSYKKTWACDVCEGEIGYHNGDSTVYHSVKGRGFTFFSFNIFKPFAQSRWHVCAYCKDGFKNLMKRDVVERKLLMKK